MRIRTGIYTSTKATFSMRQSYYRIIFKYWAHTTLYEAAAAFGRKTKTSLPDAVFETNRKVIHTEDASKI
jgi:hypothetical protein